jgi:DNA polymerase-3 subunit epsilon
MEFNLKNDLVFFDVETTGLNVLKDRILQIALIKYLPGAEEAKTLKMLINPGIPISAESIKVHGITPADVANKPTFRQVAKELYEFIGRR